MPRLTISILLVTLIATGGNKGSAAEPKVADGAETQYLLFQVWPRMLWISGHSAIARPSGAEQGADGGFVPERGQGRSARPATPGTNWGSPSGRFVSTSPTRRRVSGSATRLRWRGKTTWPWPSTSMIR